MSYNGKYVSVKRVIDAVYRDFKFDYDLQFYDAVEWIGNLIALLKVPIVLQDKITNGIGDNPPPIKIENYRGKLPCDLHQVIQCAYITPSGRITSMYYSENTMLDGYHCNNHDYLKYDDSYITADDLLGVENSNLFKGEFNENNCAYPEYKLNSGVIKTNFKDGYVQMAYKALPTDKEGLPLIPDDESWITACKFEVGSKIADILWLQDKYTLAKKQWFERERDWYVGQAVVDSKLPSLDQQQSEINNIRFIDKRNHHGSFFRNMTIPEMRYNRNSD